MSKYKVFGCCVRGERERVHWEHFVGKIDWKMKQLNSLLVGVFFSQLESSSVQIFLQAKLRKEFVLTPQEFFFIVSYLS
jgi:hypothetical protein